MSTDGPKPRPPTAQSFGYPDVFHVCVVVCREVCVCVCVCVCVWIYACMHVRMNEWMDGCVQVSEPKNAVERLGSVLIVERRNTSARCAAHELMQTCDKSSCAHANM